MDRSEASLRRYLPRIICQWAVLLVVDGVVLINRSVSGHPGLLIWGLAIGVSGFLAVPFLGALLPRLFGATAEGVDQWHGGARSLHELYIINYMVLGGIAGLLAAGSGRCGLTWWRRPWLPSVGRGAAPSPGRPEESSELPRRASKVLAALVLGVDVTKREFHTRFHANSHVRIR